jgi:thioredoxin
MARLPSLDEQSFDGYLASAAGVVMVDVTAAWCGPCRMMTPVLERLAGREDPRLTIVTLDADENAGTAARFGVRSLPTLLLFSSGVLVERIVGAVPLAVLEARVEAVLERQAAA